MTENNQSDEFRQKLNNCRFLSDEEVDEVLSQEDKEPPETLMRNIGAGVLRHIMDAEDEVLLSDQYEFAADSLFCEFAYVIDMDNNRVEVYQGFNHSPLDEDERFYHLQFPSTSQGSGMWGEAPEPKSKGSASGSEYYPVRHLRTFGFPEFVAASMQALEDEACGNES